MTRTSASPNNETTLRAARFAAFLAVALFGVASTTCRSTPDEPAVKSERPSPRATSVPTAAAKPAASAPAPSKPAARKVYSKPVAEVPISADDPTKGKFTLEQATQGLSGSGTLVADIETDGGSLECELYQDKAPISVANFVGLARGLRPWKAPDGKWVKRPGYDGTTFHRVVKGFMIQGGDPEGTGRGNPGYVIPDEIWEDAHHDRRGLLCMANRGPNTNAMQFFIMDGAAAHLDGGYTIFGKCAPDSVIEALASVPTERDRSLKPTKIKKVAVRYRPAPAGAALAGTAAAPAGAGGAAALTGTAPGGPPTVPVRADPSAPSTASPKSVPPVVPPAKPPITTPPIVPKPPTE